MKQLINFSIYAEDTTRFNHDWAAIATYTNGLDGIAGLELLIGYESPPVVPGGLVLGVHLPYWITWLNVWRNGPVGAARYFPDVPAGDLLFYCGGQSAAAMITVQRRLWQNAAALNPAYAVLHVSHVEVAHAFTRKYTYSNLEVIDAVAALLNESAATFPNGEPPVRLYLENLWWPGLTFTESEQAERLTKRLNFKNWAFVLDTGHLMNTNVHLASEDEATDYVLETISRLTPDSKKRIEGLHLNYSLSGSYQQRQIAAGLPPGFQQLSCGEQWSLGHTNASQIDQHRPFTSPRCAEIIQAVQPRFVTHEFLSATQAEYDQKLRTQQLALNGKASPT